MTKRMHATTPHHDIETPSPLQTDCVVSGVLKFVLLLSRIAGIAPLKFERTRGGCCVRVSWFYYFYSYILLIIFLSVILVYHFGNGGEIGDDRFSYGTSTDVMQLMNGICTITWITISSTIVHTGRSRMCRMIDCISQLTLVNEKMNHYYNSSPINNTILWIFVFVSLIFGYLTVSIDYALNIYDVILANKVGVLSCSVIAVYLFALIMHLYAIKFALIVVLVVSTFQRVNNGLEMILRDVRYESSISKSASSIPRHVFIDNNEMDVMNTIPRYVTCVIDLVPVIGSGGSSNPDKIRQLAIIYCSLCDVVRRLNINNGSALLVTLLFSFMHMITTPYFMFNVLFTSGSELPTTKSVSVFVYFMFALFVLATAVEPCHRTHEQLLLTRELIQTMLRYTGPEDEAVRYELKLFKRHILLNPVSFSPWQLLTFNRTTLVMVVSTVITKISVMMNL